MISMCFINSIGNNEDALDKNRETRLVEKIENKVLNIINHYAEKENEFGVIFGVTQFKDQIAFDRIDKLKRDASKTPLHTVILTEIAIPFSQIDCEWSRKEKAIFARQVIRADKISRVDRMDNYIVHGCAFDIYYPEKIKMTVKYMIDNSDVVIVVHDGNIDKIKGYLEYARIKGCEIETVSCDIEDEANGISDYNRAILTGAYRL